MTTLDQIDTRSTWQRQLDVTSPSAEFSEAEMNMIDAAAVHVFKRARAVLPSELVDFARDDDPAGVIRQWAYRWALENPTEIHGWPNGQIVKNVRRSLREKLNEYLHGYRRKELERPGGRPGRLQETPGGANTEAFERGAQVIASEKLAKKSMFHKTRPVKRPQPIKYRQDKGPLESVAMLTMIDLYGRFIPEDQQQFIIKGYRAGKPIRETSEALAKLHTRRPSRAEYWGEMFNGNGRRSLRKDLAEDTELHDNTVAAIAEDVVPAVAERFADEARPADRADVDRERLRITGEEVQRVLLEKFDVLYEE